MRFKRLMQKPSESPRSFVSMTKLIGGYHLWQSQDDNCTAPIETTNRNILQIRKMRMGNISYTAHVSNKKSAITSKSKLAGVAKHNLRKYKSSDYSKDNICIVYGTSNLIDDVKTLYHKEFDEALEEYNKKQTRPDRRIEDYFEHVAGKEQDMAVEIIIQIGDREFWKQYDDMKSYIKLSYQIMLDKLMKILPQFVVANAVIHLDEDSPHMHIVGVPVADGYKKGLRKQVSKRKVFTKEVLSQVLQDELREVANKEVNDWFGEQIKEKSKGRNHDLTVAEYKVAQESRKLEEIQQQNNEEQARNTKLRSSNASISYQITTLEKSHNRNIDMIAADEDRLEKVRDNIDAAEIEYAKYADMITDKKNKLEMLTSKENELVERTKIAENVYDMFRQGSDDDVREKLIDVMYENQKLQDENKSLKELLEKAYEFMKQFVIDGVNLLEKFLESVGKVMERLSEKTK